MTPTRPSNSPDAADHTTQPRPAARSAENGSRSRRIMAVVLSLVAIIVVAILIVVCARTCTRAATDASNQDALPSLEVTTSATYTRQSTGFDVGLDKHLVVAIDPGHGAEDEGADGGGLLESDLVWRIASYMGQALQQTLGIGVVYTRDEFENPSFAERAARAAAAKADILLSIHVNSTEDPAVHGAIVYYPNEISTWYYEETVPVAKALAQLVSDRLDAVGLTSFGITTEVLFDTEVAPEDYDHYMYPDSTGVSDFFAPIRESRKLGIPAVLIEHAYLSNPGDAILLRDEEFLRTIGEADADAVLACFGYVRTEDVAYSDTSASLPVVTDPASR